MYFCDKLSLYEIAKRAGLSRNTVRKWIRSPGTKPLAYLRQAAFYKLSPFHETLEPALKADPFRATPKLRAAKALSSRTKQRATTAVTVS